MTRLHPQYRQGLLQNGMYQRGNVITTGAAGYNVAATGDYNGDGTTDIALQNPTNGTVVDWRTSVLDELRALADRKVLRLDSVLFLDEWKAAYRPGMDDVNRGTSPWTTVDARACGLYVSATVGGLDECIRAD